MFEIEGKHGIARCYAETIEPEAIDQIVRMLDMPFAEGQSIAIMPDAHVGAGCTIGTTMTVTDAICVNLTGVDIGCGVLVANLGDADVDLRKLDEACYEVPSGFDVWDSRRKRFDLSRISCYRHLKDTRRIERSIGTLGGGNHYTELSIDSNSNKYLTIHSGSRNLGLQVAKFHQDVAVSLHEGAGDYLVARDELITRYKREGRRKEIQGALAELQGLRHECTVPKDLAWLYGQWMDDYLADVAVCQEFARLNRETMAEEICRRIGVEPLSVFHTVHNYIDVDEMVLRKGAISAKEGELVIIPLNMRDGSVLAYGKGNPDWNMSGPHGAGRLMSRSAAKETLSLADFEHEMKGVYTTSVCASTLDEAPGAYKSADDILGPIAEAVDVVEVLRPVYNFKAH